MVTPLRGQDIRYRKDLRLDNEVGYILASYGNFLMIEVKRSNPGALCLIYLLPPKN